MLLKKLPNSNPVKTVNSLPVIALVIVSLSGCNGTTSGNSGTPASTSQVQPQATALAPGQKNNVQPKLARREYEPKESELAKICHKIVDQGLIASDGSFKIDIGHSNEANGTGPFEQKVIQKATLEGNCTPGQVQITLSALESHDGPFASVLEKRLSHSFAAGTSSSTLNSTDQYDYYMPIETNGSPSARNGNKDVKATAQLSQLQVESSADSFTVRYELHGSEQDLNDRDPTTAFDYAVETQFTISAPGEKTGPVSLAFKSLGSDPTRTQELDISIQSP